MLERRPASAFLDRFDDLLASLLPPYEAEGRSYLTVAIGCTGGRHRSVAVAEELAERLRGRGIAVRTSAPRRRPLTSTLGSFGVGAGTNRPRSDRWALLTIGHAPTTVGRAPQLLEASVPTPDCFERTPHMTVRVGINGFGRIGRNFFRAAKQRGADIDFVAVNDLGSLDTMAHLLKYDSVLGMLPETIKATKDGITVGDDELQGAVGARSRRPAVGRPRRRRRHRVDRLLHRRATRPRTTSRPAPRWSSCRRRATAPTPRSCTASTTRTSTRKTHKVISNASCTTNCFVPLVKVLDDAFGVEQGPDDRPSTPTRATRSLVDGPHKDLRRARAAAINIIPTITGAARATSLVLESMKGKLDGTSLRVPVPTGSITDFTANLKKAASVDADQRGVQAGGEEGPLKGILRYTDEPIVSSDIVTDPHCVHLRRRPDA